MHDRLSVHSVAFLGSPLDEMAGYWRDLGVTRLSLLDSQLQDPQLRRIVASDGYTVQAVYHLFGSGRLPTEKLGINAARTDLDRLIDTAAELDVGCVYMLTGGRGGLDWEQAAEQFCTTVEPCAQRARQAGVVIAIENASGLYADIHLAHTLRDTITLAEMAGLGICIDLFGCWTEAGLSELIDRALGRTHLVQLSDYVLGDRALPARAVPGDGVIPIEPVVAQLLRGGYRDGFDLELIGPRIEAEGRFEAVRRGCETISAMLDRLGG